MRQAAVASFSLPPSLTVGQPPLSAFISLSPRCEKQALAVCSCSEALSCTSVMCFPSSTLFPFLSRRRGRGRRRAAPFNFTHERVPAPALMLCTALFVCSSPFSHFFSTLVVTSQYASLPRSSLLFVPHKPSS